MNISFFRKCAIFFFASASIFLVATSAQATIPSDKVMVTCYPNLSVVAPGGTVSWVATATTTIPGGTVTNFDWQIPEYEDGSGFNANNYSPQGKYDNPGTKHASVRVGVTVDGVLDYTSSDNWVPCQNLEVDSSISPVAVSCEPEKYILPQNCQINTTTTPPLTTCAPATLTSNWFIQAIGGGTTTYDFYLTGTDVGSTQTALNIPSNTRTGIQVTYSAPGAIASKTAHVVVRAGGTSNTSPILAETDCKGPISVYPTIGVACSPKGPITLTQNSNTTWTATPSGGVTTDPYTYKWTASPTWNGTNSGNVPTIFDQPTISGAWWNSGDKDINIDLTDCANNKATDTCTAEVTSSIPLTMICSWSASPTPITPASIVFWTITTSGGTGKYNYDLNNVNASPKPLNNFFPEPLSNPPVASNFTTQTPYQTPNKNYATGKYVLAPIITDDNGNKAGGATLTVTRCDGTNNCSGCADVGGTTRTNGQICNIAIGTPVAGTTGTGYGAIPYIIFIGGGGSGATATATVNRGGGISLVTLTAVGSGYTSDPNVYISPCPLLEVNNSLDGFCTTFPTIAPINYPITYTANPADGSGSYTYEWYEAPDNINTISGWTSQVQTKSYSGRTNSTPVITAKIKDASNPNIFVLKACPTAKIETPGNGVCLPPAQ